jgi:hypothetical protein
MQIAAPVSRSWGTPPCTPEGPCSVPCGHGYCHALIQQAAECCLFCNQAAGYECSFIELYDGAIVHVVCPPPPPIPPRRSLWRRVANLFT